jgi:quercetin dioxygenase-like cupin family protein
MARPAGILLFVCVFFPGLALAQSDAPAPITPESLRWTSPPNIPGLRAAWVLGAEQKPGIYVLRVHLAAGARIPPHTHPDERNTTVLSGTIHVGFGATFDETRMVAVPAGAVYVAPAHVPHYVWARDGEAMYQESGIGPTATTIIKR